jgi:hypothetical protein
VLCPMSTVFVSCLVSIVAFVFALSFLNCPISFL